MSGYIILRRAVLEWEWYRDIPVCKLWLHILLRANWQDGEYRGESVPRGAFASTLSMLAEETGLSRQQVRTALAKLQKTGEISVKAGRQYSVITALRYDEYQTPGKAETDAPQVKKTRSAGTRFKPPTVEEVAAYCREQGNGIDAEKFCDYYAANGWKVGKNAMKDWQATVRNWEKKDAPRAPDKPKSRIINGVRVYD